MSKIKNLSNFTMYSEEYKKFMKKLLEFSKENHGSSDSTLHHEILIDSLTEVAPLLSFRFKMGSIMREAFHRSVSHGYKDVFDFLFEALQAIIPFERMSIALIKEDILQSHWIKSKHPVQFLNTNYSASTKEGSLATLIRTGVPRIISDLREYYRNNPSSKSTELALKEGILSSLTFPLMTSKTTLGVIFFSSNNSHAFTEEHIEIFQEVVKDFTVILEQGLAKQNNKDNINKDKALAMVVHDLRAPVGVIMGFLDLLFEESWFKKLGENDKEIFSVLKRNSEGMLDLINGLSDLKKLSTGHLTIENQEVSFKEFMNEIFVNAVMLSRKKDIQFEHEVSKTIPQRVCFDPQRIRQVLDNLISNAIKFSYPGTTVTTRVFIEDEKMYFSVMDQGPGIPVHEQVKLFTEFGKTSVRPTSGEYSTGLGLAIVKKIVEAHKGSVYVHSREGNGSEFIFCIPLIQC